MSWTRWLSGVVVLVAVFVPPFLGAPWVRRRLVPGWPRVPQLLADAVIAISGIVLLAELLGTIHLLRAVPLLVGGPAVGLAFRAAGRPRPSEDAAGSDHGLGTKIEMGIAAVAVLALFAQALNSVGERVRHGILDPDSLHYHLTFAARFAKSGSTTAIAYVSPGDGAPYHPATAELLHGLGLVAFRVELLTLVFNLGALVLVLLAAATLGARVGRGAAAVTAIAAILALPTFGRDQAGSPANDVLAMAFVLAAAAFAVWAADERDRYGGLILTGLAAGLAIGTKLTTVVPGVLLVLAVAAAAPTLRLAGSRLIRLVPAAVLGGGYWPLRNIIHVGSPFPATDMGLPRPPMPLLALVDQSVAHYAGDSRIVRHVFLPGFRYALGPAILVVIVLLAAGALAMLLPPKDRLRQLLGGVALVAAAVYVVTPTTAAGPEGDPILFRYNIRYLGPALCLLAAGSILSPRIARLASWWAGAWLAVELVTLSSARSWADSTRRVLPLAAVIALGLVCAALVLARQRGWLPTSLLRLGLIAAAVAALGAGGFVARKYVDDLRYAHPRTDRDRLVALGRNVHGGRTGVSGLPLQYSFFGPQLQGDAEYVAEVLPDDEVRDPPTCTAWRRALRAGRYDTVVVLRFGTDPPPKTDAWTASLPGVTTALANSAGHAYKLPADIVDDGCAQ